LGDHLSVSAALAIPIATIGVLLMAIKPGDRFGVETVKPALLGIASGTFFALSAIGFRGGILALGDGPALLRATTILVWSLGIQSAVLFVWLALFNRPALLKSLALWRASSGAGFMGALASQFWFIGFSLTSAANVRTLGLVEVIFAQFVTRRVFSEGVAKRELVGITLVVIGVGLLLLPALLP
jgi:drug/metabolite transporter (DMT)-like permease